MNTPIVRQGDAIEIMRLIGTGTISAVVTDPPYELGFMGKRWDGKGIAYSVEMWSECLRVLKPGGHLASFGGSRTYHRMACAVEDAGFEIRDSLQWIYGSGFPKSRRISADIDKVLGTPRERVQLVGGALNAGTANGWNGTDPHSKTAPLAGTRADDEPRTDAARQWQGWGTALKPAVEPIVLARKPFPGTVAANTLAHSVGGLNIDATRVGTSKGRWPANVLLSHAEECADACAPGCPVALLDAQSGTSTSKASAGRNGRDSAEATWGLQRSVDEVRGHDDIGGASRFFPTFRYQAKAPTIERPKVNGVAHPTVKPLELMRWLVKLLCPSGGWVLDPFAGTGPTLQAAQLEGMPSIGIELEASYIPLIQQRLQIARNPYA